MWITLTFVGIGFKLCVVSTCGEFNLYCTMLKQNVILYCSNLHNFALYTVLNKQYFKFLGHFKEFESIRTTPYLRLTLFQNAPPENYKCEKKGKKTRG